MKKKFVALVPLRAGSKSIPLKNIKLIAGKPLCAWVLESACEAFGPENVFVSTESREIAKVVKELHFGVSIINRPEELATDTASTESVMLHFTDKVNFDTLITIQATSPLTMASDFQKALRYFITNKFDSLITGVRIKRFFWTLDGMPVNYDPLLRPRRQDFEGWIMENGAFYITKRKILERYKCRLGGKVGVYEMNPETAIEIDEPEDWVQVERYLIKKKGEKLNELLKKVELMVVDVDGTLTDAGMYYSSDGEVLKKFNTRDAQGMALIRQRGINLAMITSEKSNIVKARAKKLKIDNCYIGIVDKLKCLKSVCAKLKINLSHVAYVGDDIHDLECMKSVGFAACPADALDIVKMNAHYISKFAGGYGAVRDVCELIVASKKSK